MAADFISPATSKHTYVCKHESNSLKTKERSGSIFHSSLFWFFIQHAEELALLWICYYSPLRSLLPGTISLSVSLSLCDCIHRSARAFPQESILYIHVSILDTVISFIHSYASRLSPTQLSFCLFVIYVKDRPVGLLVFLSPADRLSNTRRTDNNQIRQRATEGERALATRSHDDH